MKRIEKIGQTAREQPIGSELKVELPAEVPVEATRLLLTIKLFETGRLSLGQSAQMAGYSKRAFLELLAKADVPVLDHPAEELKDEIGV